MSVSQLACDIKDSATLVLNEKARTLREMGEPVIHLGSGEPKSKVPTEAIEAAKAYLMTGEIRYTSTRGIPPLLEAIIGYTEENYNKAIRKENIVVSNGAKHSLYNLMTAIIDPQDEAIICAPYWVSYPEIIKMVYGKPVVVMPDDGCFVPGFKAIEEKVTSKTKAIIINSPNNPSGAIYPEDLIAELVEYCEKKGIYLVMDDIYQKLTFDGKESPSVYNYSKEDIDSSKLVVINGVSKAYAMTGFRIGWTVANCDIIKAMINVQAQNSTCVSGILQAAAAGALNGDQSGVESLRQTLENNRNAMMSELKSCAAINLIKPEGTFYCLPDFRAYNSDSVALSKFLLDKALVVTVPGVEFGLEGYLRLSYCGSIEDIKEGTARIRWALDPNSPDEIYLGEKKLIRDWT